MLLMVIGSRSNVVDDRMVVTGARVKEVAAELHWLWCRARVKWMGVRCINKAHSFIFKKMMAAVAYWLLFEVEATV